MYTVTVIITVVDQETGVETVQSSMVERDMSKGRMLAREASVLAMYGDDLEAAQKAAK
jgi:hypothetical protein